MSRKHESKDVYPKWQDPNPDIIEVSKREYGIYKEVVPGTGVKVEELGRAGDRYTNPYTGEERKVLSGNVLMSLERENPELKPQVVRRVHERVSFRELHG